MRAIPGRNKRYVKRKGFGIVNIAHEEQVRLKDSLLMICDLMDAEHDLLNFGTKEMRSNEVMKLLACTKILTEKIGFQFSRNLKDDLRLLVSE